MEFVTIDKKDRVATVTLNRGKVNALNTTVIEQLKNSFETLREDSEVRAVILTGRGKFFSFGFDIPEFLGLPKENFVYFLNRFTGFYAYLYQYPKAVIAAVNGHAVAGGCILATACDYRVMVTGKAKIALNEVTFGASLFAGSVAMLINCVGHRNAEKVLFTGAMFPAEDALELGLIDMVSDESRLMDDAAKAAEVYVKNYGAAFGSMKRLARNIEIPEFGSRERKSIEEFLEIWYSDATMRNLKQILIHS
jgi:3,2-trans-enoyl-CoA isomerase